MKAQHLQLDFFFMVTSDDDITLRCRYRSNPACRHPLARKGTPRKPLISSFVKCLLVYIIIISNICSCQGSKSGFHGFDMRCSIIGIEPSHNKPLHRSHMQGVVYFRRSEASKIRCSTCSGGSDLHSSSSL